jgi:hypothetical protein
MKKLLVVACGLFLVGAGCAKAPTPSVTPFPLDAKAPVASAPEQGKKKAVEIYHDSNGYGGFTNPTGYTAEQLIAAASADAGFNIAYPTYVPAGLELDTKMLWDKTVANPMLVSNGELKISIFESPMSNRPNTVSKRLEKLTDKESVGSGYVGVYSTQGGSISFATVIFTTADGIDVGIWSREYDKSELIKIAQSMGMK